MILKTCTVGEYAEELDWTVESEYEISVWTACAHAVFLREDRDTRLTRQIYRIPRVVIARNEGGHNCTIVCVDCILEALR